MTDPLELESEVVTLWAVSASAQMLMGQPSLTQKHQAHMPETHLVHFHQLIADDCVSEVELLCVVVPSVARLVWQNVSAQLAVFHETVGLVESSHTSQT